MRMVALGEVASVRSSLVDPTDAEFAALPHIAPDSIERDTGRLLSFTSVSDANVTSGKYRFKPGDVLYSKIRPNLNKVALVDFAGLCSADMYAITVNSADVTTRYLTHLLRSPGFLNYAARLSNRANIPKLNRTQLLSFRFRLPPLGEQRRVAAILDRADALRVKRRQVIAHLNSLAQSVFLDMFGAEQSTATLGNFGTIQGGLQVTRARQNLPIALPYLRVANVHRNRLDLNEIKTIRATAAESERTRLFVGDLLFVEGHANPLEVGRVALWDGSIEGCVHQNHLIRFRPKAEQLDPVFAVTWFNSARGAAHFRRAGRTTSGLNTISASTVRSAPTLIPPMSKQRVFSELARESVSRQAHMRRELQELDALFASLQSRAFRGER